MTAVSNAFSLVGDHPLLDLGKSVIATERDALTLLQASLGESFVQACETIFATERQLVVTGMGKSGHIGRKAAATFAATGTPAVFIHPAEAGHGDLGMVMEGDTLLVLSNSGNTAELRTILRYARSARINIVGIGSKAESLLMKSADIGILLPPVKEACPANIAPTTSTVLQLAVCDALAMCVMDMRGVSKMRLQSLHPGGDIGLKLAPIREVMHSGAEMPLVTEHCSMSEVIFTMTAGRFGVAGVVDGEGRLTGMITDGDLRRHIDELGNASARDIMTQGPHVVAGDMLASDVLVLMNEMKITSVFVTRDGQCSTRPLGIVHIHDLLRMGLN